VVVLACDPSTWRLKQEDLEFEASLGYTERACLKNRAKQAKTNNK
jgi:hypothetical protein